MRGQLQSVWFASLDISSVLVQRNSHLQTSVAAVTARSLCSVPQGVQMQEQLCAWYCGGKLLNKAKNKPPYFEVRAGIAQSIWRGDQLSSSIEESLDLP
jgi:hypothetical protein